MLRHFGVYIGGSLRQQVPKKGIEGGMEAFEGIDALNPEDLEVLKEVLEAPAPAKATTNKRTKEEAAETDGP